jgi:hypothetical protein
VPESERKELLIVDPDQKRLIEAQIKRVSRDPIDKFPELRNHAME